MKRQKFLAFLTAIFVGSSFASCAMPETDSAKAAPETLAAGINKSLSSSNEDENATTSVNETTTAKEKNQKAKSTKKKKSKKKTTTKTTTKKVTTPKKSKTTKKKTTTTKATTKKATTTTPKPTTTTQRTTTTQANNTFNGVYILNLNTKKYHTDPNCRGVHDMKPENRQDSYSIPDGYTWCKWCSGGR